MTEQSPTQTIVFFDGVCHLCNAAVDFLVARDPKQRLRFAALQGQTSAKLLPPTLREDLKTVLVWKNGKILQKSSAILASLQEIGGVWKLLALLGAVFPKFLRDAVYDVVARNRYRWFGQRETCRIPTAEERRVLLD